MKLHFDNEEIRQHVIEISKQYPKLGDRLNLVFTKLKSFDYDDLELHINEELHKSAHSQQIKYIPNEKVYEYRIPPHCKYGVLRMNFVVEDDRWTVCIKRVWTKGTKPVSKKERR